MEEVIELVIREFGADLNPGWEDRVNKCQLAYRDRQTDTIISKNLERSVEILKGLGFKVECPKGFKFPEKYISDEW